MEPRTIKRNVFDIQDRTFQFSVRTVALVCKFPRSVAGIELGRQLVRAGTSVGSNVEEADGALSRKDFINYIRIARKEARESRYWLRLVKASKISADPEFELPAKEADEIVRILSGIVTSATAA